MSTPTIWGIHAGKTGDAHSLFLQKNVVAVGWTAVGDLSVISPNREAFKAAVAKAYPTAKPGAIPNNAGQLFRFVHEMKQGDLVVYPSKADRTINIGKVTGDYHYDPQGSGYPNLRSVQWLKAVPRLKFSQGALYEIGSAMSLFQVKNYADEFRAALEGKQAAVPVKEDPTVPLVQSDIEETTRDFIIKALAQELKGHPFADFVAHLLNTMGYRTRVSPEGTDGGVDIIAHKDELGFEPPIIKVQVKSGEASSIGDPVVAALYGKVDPKEFGLFVTLGTYSNPAKQFARGKANLRLIDGDELVDLILMHYEQFDSRYKGVLPLKRVYVPDPDETEETE
jgi:restriction system protein